MLYRFVNDGHGNLERLYFTAATMEEIKKAEKQEKKTAEMCRDEFLKVVNDSWNVKLNWSAVAELESVNFNKFMKNIFPYMTESQILRLKSEIRESVENYSEDDADFYKHKITVLKDNLKTIEKKEAPKQKKPEYMTILKWILNRSHAGKFRMIEKAGTHVYVTNTFQCIRIPYSDYEYIRANIKDLPEKLKNGKAYVSEKNSYYQGFMESSHSIDLRNMFTKENGKAAFSEMKSYSDGKKVRPCIIDETGKYGLNWNEYKTFSKNPIYHTDNKNRYITLGKNYQCIICGVTLQG